MTILVTYELDPNNNLPQSELRSHDTVIHSEDVDEWNDSGWEHRIDLLKQHIVDNHQLPQRTSIGYYEVTILNLSFLDQ